MEVTAEGRLNMMSITIEQFHQRIRSRFKRGNVTLPILVLGPVGIGKTEGIVELAEELGVGFRSLRLANLQETDLIGLPKMVERNVGDNKYSDEEIEAGSNLIVRWVQQGFLPDPHDVGYKDNGILFLDEITNCNRATQAAAWQLMDSTRGIGDYHLPDGWLIVAAGNGPEDGGNYTSMSSALLGRCESFRIEPDFASWKHWAIDHDVHFMVIAYLDTYKDSLWKWNPNETLADAEKFPQPRCWVEVSKNLKYAEEEIGGGTLSATDVLMECGGWIGEKEAHEFVTFYILKDQMIDIDSIADGTASVNVDSLRREVKYIQSEALMTKMIEYMSAYQKEKKEIDFQRVMNCYRFCMALAVHNLDITLDTLQSIGRSKYYSSYIDFNIEQQSRINAECPEWATFYSKHREIFDKNNK